jgi:hypothetical protein
MNYISRLYHIICVISLAFFLHICNESSAQVEVSSAGGTVFNANGELSYTIGQVAASAFENTSLMVNIGVQQPYCQSSTDTIHAFVCQNSSYDSFDFAITAEQNAHPGIYSYSRSLTNIGGCDSIVVLLLTVKSLSTSEDTAVACDSYSWNGIEYNESLDTTVIFADADGCDSTVILRITINHSSSTDFSQQASYEYEWNGIVYHESGIYHQSFTNIFGCDSTVNLDLTVIHKPLPIILSHDKRLLVVDHYPLGQKERVDYAAYQWYCDGMLLIGAESDHYFQDGYPQLQGCYYVMVPANPTQTRWVRSNTICMDNLGIEDVESKGIEVAVTPNPVLSEHDLTVVLNNAEELDLQGMVWTLYDNNGRTLQTGKAIEPRFVVSMPYGAGQYTLSICAKGGRRVVKKVVVHR